MHRLAENLKFELKVLIPKEDKWAFDQGGMSYKGNGNLFYTRNFYIGTAGFFQIDKTTFICRKNCRNSLTFSLDWLV